MTTRVLTGDALQLQGRPVADEQPDLGDVLKWDGNAWSPQPDSSVTNYTATLWVDPAGDPSSDGLSSERPTTLENALVTVPVGGLILPAAGDYTAASPPFVVSTQQCSINGYGLAASGAVGGVRLLSNLSITAPNANVVGLRLAGVTDSSAAAGTTNLTGCVVTGSTVVGAPVSGQALELTNTTFGALSVTTSSGGAFLRMRNGCRGGVVTHATTGAVTVEVYESTVNQIACSGGGSLSTITYNARLTNTVSINVSSGTATRTTLVSSVCGDDGLTVGFGGLVLTGAPSRSVRIYDTRFNTSTSTIPGGSEVLAHGTDAKANTVIGNVTTSNPPGSAVTYVSLPPSGPPIQLDPFTVYESSGSFTLSVTANNTVFWVDLLLNGAPSPIGAFEAPLGIANAQDVRAVLTTFPGALIGSTFTGSLQFAKSALVVGGGSVTMKTATLKLVAVL